MPGGSLKLRGRVRAVLGDNIDTDIIYPGRYLNITDREKTAEHLFELLYPEIRAGIQPDDMIVAGRNFGCGSSREQAAAALKFAGAGAVIAASFARIFFRNAINLGLAAVVSPEAAVVGHASARSPAAAGLNEEEPPGVRRGLICVYAAGRRGCSYGPRKHWCKLPLLQHGSARRLNIGEVDMTLPQMRIHPPTPSGQVHREGA